MPQRFGDAANVLFLDGTFVVISENLPLLHICSLFSILNNLKLTEIFILSCTYGEVTRVLGVESGGLNGTSSFASFARGH